MSSNNGIVKPSKVRVVDSAKTDLHPVSYAQEALFYAHKHSPASKVRNSRVICEVSGHVDESMMFAALGQILGCHPILQTAFLGSEDEVSQYVTASPTDFASVDARLWSGLDVEAQIKLDSAMPFNLENGQVFRSRLYKTSEKEYRLLLCAHEIVADSRSLRIVARDLQEIYSSLIEGRTAQQRPNRTNYFDHARYERELLQSDRGRALLESSRSRLSGDKTVLDLPWDRRRSRAIPSSETGTVQFQLTPELTQKLEAVAGEAGTDRYSLYLAAYAVLLSRYGSTQNVLIASSGSTRTNTGLTNVVGNFTNLVAIAAECTPELSFRQFLSQVANSAQTVRENEELPFSVLVRNLNLTVEAGRGPLCEAYFICDRDDSPSNALTNSSISIQPVKSVDSVYGPFDVALRIEGGQVSIEGSLLYRTDLFEAGTIERMVQHFAQLLESIAGNPEEQLCNLELMTDDERALVLGSYAGHAAEYPHVCLHELFAQHVALRPQAEAVVFGSKRLTYRELDLRSNQVAQFLRAQGLAKEELVGIFMDRSADMIVAMLGILKAGGVYVPIDPEYPAERLQFLVEDTSARWILTHEQVQTQLPGTATLVCVDGAGSPIDACSREPIANISTPDSLAVLIYTSGSTGRPKGACIPHRAAVRTVCNTNYLHIGPEDRVAQCASPSFDAAIQEIWSALLNGATLVGVRRETLLTPMELVELLRTERITSICLNTAFLHQIGREAPEILKDIKYVIFGGEAAEPGPIREILKHGRPGALINGYGPAEGCVISTYHEITSVPEDAKTVLIGRPVTNAQVYLLDRNMRPVPLGVTGEIYIGGEGVACGYWRRPDLNADKFLPNVFSGKPGALLYRTGDLARMRSNGEIEFVGRADHQVKIRGYRIELPEVQLAVASHPDVKQVFVMLREDQPGDKRLVAYVTIHREMDSAPEVLRQHVKDKLPPYMVPASFVVVDAIALTTNGKVDRNALPVPNDRPNIAAAYTEAKSDLERVLTGIWQELLGVDKIGVHDDFFDLGGHSLLAARMIARIEKKTGHNIPVATLFAAPTVSQLARKLEDRSYAGEWSPLIELNRGNGSSDMAPFFCIHSLGANLVSFHQLAWLLRGDRPVYGLQPHGLDGKQAPFDNMKDMAAAYLKEIRARQPHGPYYLGGICLGGVVAYEIAQQLHAAGEETKLLVMIDSFLPGPLQHMHSRSHLVEYLDCHLGEMLLLPPLAQLKYFARWVTNGGIRLAWSLGWRERGSLARATERIAKANVNAVLTYDPKPFAGRITQFICSDGPHRSYEDRRLAWSTLTEQGLELHVVPGNHLSMVEEPNIQVMAKKLQLCLDRAEGVKNAAGHSFGHERNGVVNEVDVEHNSVDFYNAAQCLAEK